MSRGAAMGEVRVLNSLARESMARQERYLRGFARALMDQRRGASSTGAKAAGVRLDSVAHWRKRYPGFVEREEDLLEQADLRHWKLCPSCDVAFRRKRPEQVFCTKSCANRHRFQ